MFHILYIGLGGFAGSILRYIASKFINELYPSFPLGTLTVNVIGSLLIGFIIYSISMGKNLSPELRDLMTVGFIGGFTTMSAFAYETFRLSELNQVLLSLLNIILSIVLCIIAVFLGKVLAQVIFK